MPQKEVLRLFQQKLSGKRQKWVDSIIIEKIDTSLLFRYFYKSGAEPNEGCLHFSLDIENHIRVVRSIFSNKK